jgi:hypothetical protein
VIIDPYLVGFLYGDGWSYKRSDGSYVTCVDQAEKNKRIILEEAIPRFRNMGFNTKPYRFFAKHDGIFKWRALVYSKALHLEVKKIFAKIISYFRSLSDEDAKSFIAGFADAEGTVGKRQINIYNQNTRLLRAIRTRLKEFGIAPTYIYRYDNTDGLAIMRKDCIRRLVQEIPALKFDMYHNNSAISWAFDA